MLLPLMMRHEKRNLILIKHNKQYQSSSFFKNNIPNLLHDEHEDKMFLKAKNCNMLPIEVTACRQPYVVISKDLHKSSFDKFVPLN